MSGYELSDDPTRVDLDVIWGYLSTEAYWARWRTRSDVAAQVTGAWRVVAAYDGTAMVGFSRAVSDGIALAYLADVFVLPEHRGHGLGRDLVRTMVDEGPGRDFRWMLHTADAHDLYRDFGFTEPDATYLERPAAAVRLLQRRRVGPIRLEPLAAEHAPVLRETMRDPQIVRFTRAPDPMPADWLDTWLLEFDGHQRAAWAILLGGDFAGYAVTGPIDHEGREVELGYAVSDWARGHGVATATLRLVSRWALDRGMLRLTALISVDNPASSRVAAKAGYTLEGVLRSMHHRDELRTDLESWSLLPGELAGPVVGEIVAP